MSSKYFFLTKLFFFFFLYQSSFCQNECIYKEKRTQSETNKTDAKFLSNINSEDGKKQKCFSLSKSDVFTDLCCYNTETKLCIKDPGSASDPIVCPKVATTIVNNCGMASIYQPETAERCTETDGTQGTGNADCGSPRCCDRRRFSLLVPSDPPGAFHTGNGQ